MPMLMNCCHKIIYPLKEIDEPSTKYLHIWNSENFAFSIVQKYNIVLQSKDRRMSRCEVFYLSLRNVLKKGDELDVRQNYRVQWGPLFSLYLILLLPVHTSNLTMSTQEYKKWFIIEDQLDWNWIDKARFDWIDKAGFDWIDQAGFIWSGWIWINWIFGLLKINIDVNVSVHAYV